MSRRTRRFTFPILMPTVLGGGAPQSVAFDFSALPDGSLPSQLSGATWTITSGVALNSPTLGTEVYADPGLEGTYTAGLCTTGLTKVNSPTLAESADVHGGSKAQQFTATAANTQAITAKPASAGIAGQWWQCSAWVKRTAGTAGFEQLELFSSSIVPETTINHICDTASYTQKRTVVLSTGTDAMSHFLVSRSASTFDTIIIDDISRKPITLQTMIAYTPQLVAGQTVKAAVNLALDGGIVGAVSHIDNPTNPQNFIMAYLYRTDGSGIKYLRLGVLKCVNGTYTHLAATNIGAYGAYTPGDVIEIRPIGSNQFDIYYKGVKRGATHTISDASIVSNKYYGMMATEGGGVSDFFVEPPTA